MRIYNQQHKNPVSLLPELFLSSIYQSHGQTPLVNDSLFRKANYFSEEIKVEEQESQWIYQWIIPGIKKDEVLLSLDGLEITVLVGKDITSESQNYSPNSVSRKILCPAQSDTTKIKASLNHGILEIVLPKLPKTEARKINLE
ncbi:MAG: hypothetical protein CMI27_03485 [Opitutae bacterium]|nr:hypothetical protein [Opitutae bacterium]|tara:strand:+ start:6685 stop:7113 length:429 start_codon:yes stop_codon:yes gene_type:complete